MNRFFSSVVRIQTDRGHHVVTTGPYRYVRHPGYAGLILLLVCSGVALGSWLSALPLVPAILILLLRTVLEDWVLRNGLLGYTGYAERVPDRLVPGVW